MEPKDRITQGMIDLYDEYTHVTLDRRDFMSKLTKLAGSAAAASALAPLLFNNYAMAQVVAPDDGRISTEWITFEGGSGPVRAYLVTPTGVEGPLPSVVVVHENRGLNPHIQDVARRLGTAGFLTLAVDFLSPVGGTPDPFSDETAAQRHGQLNQDLVLADANAAVGFLAGLPRSNGNVGIVGFCFGGAVVNRVAVSNPDLDAGVVYYGSQEDAAAAANIRARMMFHYGELDTRITGNAAAYEEALRAANVDFQSFVYAGANHAFNNDTNAARYDAEAAALAWSRTVAFFHETLAAAPPATAA